MFTFLTAAGQTLFVRDDAERADWTQEEMSLECEFPFRPDAVISTGQRIVFADPSTGDTHVYEVKQCKNREPDHYQRITAESIAISELSDEHTDRKEFTNVSASTALSSVLSGTLWTVGKNQVTALSSGDLARGSVWQAILTIKTNWNCYISPRVTVNSAGQITRYLDILSTEGTWNGIRLSIEKNIAEPTITIDDSEVATALYGYGGTIIAEEQGEENKEVTFADFVWSKTSAHPAKPRGQLWLEDPDATAKYGRNGRKRWGFYQNTQIKDPETLLQKTWEALKVSRYPSVMFEGTISDLRRLGYADEPLRLHDLALVEVNTLGFSKQIQIIKMVTDLLRPDNTFLTIGDYVPNIVYISRETNEEITGTTGGGGGKNKSKQKVRSEYETTFHSTNRMIELRAYQNDLEDMNNDMKLMDARITVEADKINAEVINRTEGDNILSGRITIQADKITQEVTRATKAEGTLAGRITIESDKINAEVTRAKSAENTLSGRITVEAGKITQIVQSVGADGQVTAASIVAAVNGGSSTIKLSADHIDIDGLVNKLETKSIGVGSLHVEGRSDFLQGAYFEAGLSSDEAINVPSIIVGTTSSNTHEATWKTASIKHATNFSTQRAFCYGSTSGVSGTVTGYVALDYETTTIHYLGY